MSQQRQHETVCINRFFVLSEDTQTPAQSQLQLQSALPARLASVVAPAPPPPPRTLVVHRFECPHCRGSIELLNTELACRILRHGTFKQSGAQIPQHLPEAMCNELVAQNKIWGCGKPIKIVQDTTSGQEVCVACDYI